MATPNANDGTQLGTGEIISDEYIDPALGSRLDPDQSVGPYKLPRSKLAIGPYGQDFGDISNDLPLPAESRYLRQVAEIQQLREREAAALRLCRYASETVTRIDARGHDITNRGIR